MSSKLPSAFLPVPTSGTVPQKSAKAVEPHDPHLSHKSLISQHPLENGEGTKTDRPTPSKDVYYGLPGNIVRMIEPHTEADPVALLIQLLVAFGNVVGSSGHFIADGAKHGVNLFVVLVGLTSKGRKGTAWANIRRLFQIIAKEWSDTRVLPGLSSGEGLIWAVRDPIMKREPIREKGKLTGEYQEFEADPGVIDKRLLVLETEFASVLRVFGREGNTLSALIRQAWDTGHLQTLTKNSPARATGAHISIIGHITHEELRRYLDSTEAANGLGNRFLWPVVHRSKCLPEGGNINEADLATLALKLSAAWEFATEVGEMKRDIEARKLWIDVYPNLSDGKPGMVGAMTSRAEAQVMRLACLYALLDQSSIIQLQHLKAALALWEYCEASAKYIFGGNLGDPVADQILDSLKQRSEGMTRTEIRDLFQRHQGANQINRALASLFEKGLIRKQVVPTNGRPTERWFAIEVQDAI